MPTYEIEQYEIHSMTYRVEADDAADAIVKLLDGEADPVDNSQEYIELADERGLLIADHPELADKLRTLGVPVENVIPSIRSVTQLDGSMVNSTSEDHHVELTDQIELPKSD